LHAAADADHGSDHGAIKIQPMEKGTQPEHHVVQASLLGFHATAWYKMLFWVGMGTAFLTAFYTFRAFIMTFHGPERIPEEAGHHAHESPPVMTIPLWILSVGAAFLGLILGHWFGWFDLYLNRTLPGMAEHHAMDLFVAGVSSLLAVAGIGLAFVMYGQPSTLPAKVAAAFGPLTRLSENKFYLDEIYLFTIVLPLRGLAQACRFLDWILVDGVLVEFFARVPREIGRLLRPVQNGLVQFYALSMVLMTAFIMWALLLR
jgi:NADH-quinone oxidoreductase subunit L